MTITINGIEFTGPKKELDNVKDGKGVYLIMKYDDTKDGSDYYTTIYVGQTSSFEDRLTSDHHKYDCWTRHANPMYHALHFMPDSTEEQRKKIEKKIKDAKSPICND